MRIKVNAILILLILSPFLLSFDSTAYDDSYFAKYKSPEGTLFLSYSDNWDESKLENLYKELIKNKHGDEMKFLQEVRVQGNAYQKRGKIDNSVRGHYHALTSTITLYQGDQYLKSSDFSAVLAHEYGHHFAYYYFKSHHIPFSKWAQLRGLNSNEVRWDAFWNYSPKYEQHKWYPQEIFADDYVLLYGATEKIALKDVYSNEAFYLRTEHENQQLQNILEQTELHQYLKETAGLTIEKNRLLKTPTLLPFTAEQDKLQYKITAKTNVAYRLTVKTGSGLIELLKITDNLTTDTLEFTVKEIKEQLRDDRENVQIRLTLDVLDLNTGIGFKTTEECFEILNQKQFQQCMQQ